MRVVSLVHLLFIEFPRNTITGGDNISAGQEDSCVYSLPNAGGSAVSSPTHNSLPPMANALVHPCINTVTFR